MKIKYNSKILKTYLFFFIFMLVFKIIAKNYTIVITESLPLGVYRLYSIKDTIEIGDIVQFKPDEDTVKFIKNRGYLPEIANTLVKEVAADKHKAIRNPEKLRKNQPKEEPAEEVAE